MMVRWNRNRPGFQDHWLWQFGQGPFEVLEVCQVPSGPRILGWPGQRESVEMTFEPGRWFTIKLPPDNHFREYRIDRATLFHENWFVLI